MAYKKYFYARGNKEIKFAYGFSPSPENLYAEIVPMEEEAIRQWGKGNFTKIEIKFIKK